MNHHLGTKKTPKKRNRFSFRIQTNSSWLRKGFSLVEVAVAMGVVSFSLLGVVTLLPAGLTTVKESADEAARSAIVRRVRAELNQADFADVVNGLPGERWYFDAAGIRLDSGAAEFDRFYEVTFRSDSPELPGNAAAFEESACRMVVTIRSPTFAPPATQTTHVVSLLTSRQSGWATAN